VYILWWGRIIRRLGWAGVGGISVICEEKRGGFFVMVRKHERILVGRAREGMSLLMKTDPGFVIRSSLNQKREKN